MALIRGGVFYLLVVIAALWLSSTLAQGYSGAVEQWRPHVQDACGWDSGCEERIMWLIACESGGNPGAVSENVNPGTGMHDYGLVQISPIWGDVAYADGVTQIHWAAANLGSVWWAC